MAETFPPSDDDSEEHTLRRRAEDLSRMHRSLLRSPEAVGPGFHQLMQDCFAELQSRSTQMDAEEPSLLALTPEDLDAYMECLKTELGIIDQESKAVSDEFRALMSTMTEESYQLESSLLRLENSLKPSDSWESNECQDAAASGGLSMINDASIDYEFKKAELDILIEKICGYVSSLEDIQYELERDEVMRQIEDKFSDIEVIDFEANCIRLTLKIYVKRLEGLLQKFESAIEPSCFNYELLIELVDGTTELKNLKVDDGCSPVEMSRKFSQGSDFHAIFKENRYLLLCPSLLYGASITYEPSPMYSLQMIISRVQQKLYLCTLRRLLVKIANGTRSVVEYVDREETITAHLLGRFDATIKASPGWPSSSSSALQLVLLRNSGVDKNISLSSLSRIKELANALDAEIRWDLGRFIDSIEEIILLNM